MANLTHLFQENQPVYCKTEIGFIRSIVKEVYEDHIIVDVPHISDHMWYEEGWNIGDVYPIYGWSEDFKEDEEPDYDPNDVYNQRYISPYDVYSFNELF